MPRKAQFAHIAGHPGYAISRDGRVFTSKRSHGWEEVKVRRGLLRYRQPMLYVRAYDQDGKLYLLDVFDALAAAFLGPRPPGCVMARVDTKLHWYDCGRADRIYWMNRAAHLAKYRKKRPLRLTDERVRNWRWTLRQTGWDVPAMRAWAAEIGVAYNSLACAACGITHKHLNATCPPAERPKGRRLFSPTSHGRHAFKLTPADREAIRFRLSRGERPAVVHLDFPQVKRSRIYKLKRGK